MKAGRPKGLKRKYVKQYVRAGRYDVRIKRLHAKQEKLGMLEALIVEQSRRPQPDQTYLADLKERHRILRLQRRVLSTTDVMERP